MNYDAIFDKAIDRLHAEGRYRVFIDILRNKGKFPNARCFAGHNGPKPITVWCSNDYLCMGQHPKVIAAMEEALQYVLAASRQGRPISQPLPAASPLFVRPSESLASAPAEPRPRSGASARWPTMRPWDPSSG